MTIDRPASPLTPALSPRCGEREPPIRTMRLLLSLCASDGTTRLLPSPRASGERGGGEGAR